MKIKRFLEMYGGKYDYGKIIELLSKTHGWGQGVYFMINDFENNKEYFIDPIDEHDYAEQFHIFLTDSQCGRLRGEMNRNHSLRLGKWKIGIPVQGPVNFYSKLT